MWEFQKGRTILGESEEPVAVETELEWVFSGPLERKASESKQEVSVNFVPQNSVAIDRANLESAVSKLWDLESLGIKAGDEVHESFESEINFVDGRYSVKLPWKQGHDPLPSNYEKSRVESTKSRVDKMVETNMSRVETHKSRVYENLRVDNLWICLPN